MSRLAQYRPALFLILAVLAVTPFIAGNRSYLDTGLTIATTALIALSVGLCYGEAGILSVAQAAFASLGAYTTAILTTDHGWPLAAGLAAALIVPPAVAYPLALLVIRLSPLALGLATIVASEIFYEVVSGQDALTGGFLGISGVPFLPFADPVMIFLFAWALVILVVILMSHIKASTQGRALRVVRTDPLLAQSLGVSVTQRLAATFAVSASIAGLAGWLYAHTRGFLAPESLPLDLSITVLMMAIIGGRTRVLGPVLGAVLLVLVFEFIPSAQAQGMFYGTVLVLVLIFFPSGILGIDVRRSRLWRRLRPRAAVRPPSSTAAESPRTGEGVAPASPPTNAQAVER